jgi:hypothetical protein
MKSSRTAQGSESIRDPVLDEFKQAKSKNWIPAFAGMTSISLGAQAPGLCSLMKFARRQTEDVTFSRLETIH